MSEPSLFRTDPCLLPVIYLANAWMKSEMKAKNYYTPTLTTSRILLVLDRKEQ